MQLASSPLALYKLFSNINADYSVETPGRYMEASGSPLHASYSNHVTMLCTKSLQKPVLTMS